MTLHLNALLQAEIEPVVKRVERILYIDGLGEQVVTIEVFNPRALPVWQEAAELEGALRLGHLRVLVHDPLISFRGSEETLPEKHS